MYPCIPHEVSVARDTGTMGETSMQKGYYDKQRQLKRTLSFFVFHIISIPQLQPLPSFVTCLQRQGTGRSQPDAGAAKTRGQSVEIRPSTHEPSTLGVTPIRWASGRRSTPLSVLTGQKLHSAQYVYPHLCILHTHIGVAHEDGFMLWKGPSPQSLQVPSLEFLA